MWFVARQQVATQMASVLEMYVLTICPSLRVHVRYPLARRMFEQTDHLR
jgi:hypothetical protein